MFGSDPLARRDYVRIGVSLMLLKYALEVVIVYATTQRIWLPWVFASPIASVRAGALPDDASWVLVLLGILSLPFIYIGLSCTVRRAVDARVSPWLAVTFLVPFLNFLAMLAFASVPTGWGQAANEPPRDGSPTKGSRSLAGSIVLGIAGAITLAIVGLAAAAALGSYGSVLFVLLPVLVGVLVGHEVNRHVDQGLGRTAAAALAAAVGSALAFLLFALEGAVCILMVLPIGIPLILLGAIIGRQIAIADASRRGSFAAAFALPFLLVADPTLESAPTHRVVTSVEVAAPPAVVFDSVIAFPPIDAPRPWYFRTGIAVPLSARIEGRGVGAVRHCEFTTGAFVEPITHWEPGRRLAFDVTSSPPPMEEWSPYAHIHPPHLDSTMRSRRGEFRLTPLPGGGTKLEGITEYALGLAPDAYFAVFADTLVHRIHERVLRHVARNAEAAVRRSR